MGLFLCGGLCVKFGVLECGVEAFAMKQLMDWGDRATVTIYQATVNLNSLTFYS